ncbi:bifunctional lysylphosphatidylglycerol synthetase/lysine--tRNA ligase LysX [Williamsia sp. CHRR-6]|uniref:bifunctional lysylphosphatidylglycerol synthetase/lysine--tRNA ligase LysX n=1 Tax=Williamsia sp. CHRR-6 TaxID=2835871 RepID=UPI001BD988BA|nr:bifunctional lysylphosphatidylglycerol synthetase/lysine--tRNA ligase LysX [Williamsia sp. CHRR-6]MBT0567652.1 bifunctional lysylphosphatidylglycerol synthetase/lysine--tRNA ligase LysX [Williamsia sp. CHRR-6]
MALRSHDAPTVAGRVVGAFTLVLLISSISPLFRHLIAVPRHWVDTYVISAPDTSFAWVVVLALISVALSARKRIAWWVTLGYVTVFAATNAVLFVPAIGRQADIDRTDRINLTIGLALDAVIAGYLLATRRQFFTRVRRGAVVTAAAVLFGGLATATALGWALVEAFPRDLTPAQHLPYAFNRVVAFATASPRTFDGRRSYMVIDSLLGLLGAVALIAAAAVLFRSQRRTGLLTPTDERVLRALVDAYAAEDSLGYFATRRDRAVVFAPSGRAAVSYRVFVGVGLAAGDPIGDPRYWPHAIAEFLEVCRRYGWYPAAHGVSERGAIAYGAVGMTALTIGDECIVDARRYRISGPQMRGVRQAVTRARRAGLSVRIRRHRELDAAEMAAVIDRADRWRDTDSERGYAMALGRLGDPGDADCLLVEAVRGIGTADEDVVGMLSFVPWGRTGASLDLMRRDRSDINGVVELMVSELCLNAGTFGITTVSLNFAAFRAVFADGDRIGASPFIRGARGVLSFASRFVQMESLYRSNAKYLPTWTPRYLCCEDTPMLLRAGLAAIVSEGFIPLPRLARRVTENPGPPALPADIDVDELIADIAAHAHAAARPPKRPEQVRVRMAALAELTAAGITAYPQARPPTHRCSQARNAPPGSPVEVAGRVLRLRDLGGVVFAEVRDWSGSVQVLFEAQIAGAATTSEFARVVDLGDLVSVRGHLGRSRSGEISVVAQGWSMQGKCLQPLPDKWHGLVDAETRVRQRYLELAVDPSAAELLRIRARAVKAIRDTLCDLDFVEVETPILQRVHGGANATPFRTHINAYDLDLYLRIAPELYLKRLCVAGVERVFELGRNFRNEGVDHSHNPEFTSLEAYWAHSDYRRLIPLTQELICAAAVAAHGRAVVRRPDDTGGHQLIDISGQWAVISVFDAISAAVGQPVGSDTDVDRLRTLCEQMGVAYQPSWEAGELALELYEQLVEGATTTPTFYVDFPTSVSPLTRACPDDPAVAQRWDLVAWGVELGTAYSELTDPVEQRSRLLAQSQRAAQGDPEAMEVDEDFLTALEYGMPPTGGLGLGIDRVIMMITGASIRETVTFPLAKPR